ncbi:EthD family reductase [Spirosoma rhododendri]|uniref:EthD family reductase n=1 Tax=Spirosoma rhododendri TaxID=2728024 RepID=A0A7L5DN67_9BACT|nr:EthD family reductase [Spirosoma rhododendri]QJD79846.1 EthD family reductase [Spirosoma rhododendri]
MVRLTVLYPKTADSTFDMDYYLDTHIPLVKERLTHHGLVGVDLQEGLSGGGPGDLPTYAMITGLIFNTTDELSAGMGVHGPELLGDIPNFTDQQPLTQVCRSI